MKKSTKKLILSLALVGTVGIGSTLAYLATTGNTVTNSFVAGKGYPEGNQSVYIDEIRVNSDGTLSNERTGKGNVTNQYKNVSEGGTLTKDPQVHLAANSVESYILVKIEGLDDNENKLTPAFINEDGEDSDGINDAWTKISTNDGLDGIYIYNIGTVTPTTTDYDIPQKLFDKMKVADNIQRDDEGNATFTNIVLSVCAMQAVTYDNGEERNVSFDKNNVPAAFKGSYTLNNYSFSE